MGLKIWIDDKLVDRDQANVSVFDHGLLYGDGVFEGIRIYNSKIFKLDEHLDRLYQSAKVIRLDIPMNKQTLADAAKKTAQANNIDEGYIRLIVTRGVGNLGLNPFVCEKGGIIIIADTIQVFQKVLYGKGLKVISSSVVRNHPLAFSPQVKSLNYLNNILAKIEAIDAGADEAIMYNHLGFVAEASVDNIFTVDKGVIYTPPIEAGLLAGITRRIVMQLAREANIEVIEKNLTKFDLYTCEELFLTGTAVEVIGIVDVDGRVVGDGKPGPITKLLKEKFFDHARS
jgi:branched-chain amino acid aminotransferase